MLVALASTVGGVSGLLIGVVMGAILGLIVGFVVKRRASRWCEACGGTLHCPACVARQRTGQRPVRL